MSGEGDRETTGAFVRSDGHLPDRELLGALFLRNTLSEVVSRSP
jgi:hypothetical protein